MVRDRDVAPDAPASALQHPKWRGNRKQRAEQAATELSKANARYEHNYDAALRLIVPDIQVGGHVSVSVERPNATTSEERSELRKQRKLSSVLCGPYEVIEVD